MLSSRATPNTSKDSYGAYGYQPNLVARQFGLVQVRPCSFYQSKYVIKKPRRQTLLKKYNGKLPNFSHLCFKLSYEWNKSFFLWWRGYFVEKSKEVNLDNLLSELISAFTSLQKKSKKPRGTHIREIQAFQNYFETVYDPLHLSRTVQYAAQTLKEKLLVKLYKLKFPPLVENKYLFAIYFKVKFPPLPSSELTLAFRPPYPKWFICGNVL